MILTSTKFWKPVIGFIVLDFIILVFYTFWAIGHWEGGDDTWMLIVFPLGYLFYRTGIGLLFIFQWAIYGIIIGIGNYKNKFNITVAWIAVIHIVAAVLSVVLDKVFPYYH